MRYRFAHLVDGELARFDGCQVVKTSNRTVPTAASLAQIRREQRATRAWRKQQGYGNSAELGYVRLAG